MAGEANLPFISCVGSEFNEIYVGTGQKKIREIFNLARKKSPCIIFIDEIDGLGSRSSRKAPYMDNEEIAKTINQVVFFIYI